MFHFLDGGFPSCAWQSLLHNEILAMANGTARHDQTFRARRQCSTHGGQIILLRRGGDN
jgi:hypothetical protein